MGSALAGWAGGLPGEIHGPAVRALLAGYAEEAELPRSLDLGIFSAILCAEMNWLVSRIRIALREPDPEARELAAKAVPWLLERHPTRARYEGLLDAARS